MDLFILYLLTFFLIWHYLFNKLFADNARQSLFEIRDNAFLEKEHNEEYYRFRDEINEMIKFCERASWQRVLFNYYYIFKAGDIKPQTVEVFKDDMLRVEFYKSLLIVGRLLLLKSPTLLLFGVMLIIITSLKFQSTTIKAKIESIVMQDIHIYRH